MKHVHMIAVLCLVPLCGCVTTSKSSDSESKSTLNLNPLVGLIGMAVDGDDKDDYEKFFDDDCHCGKCKKCR